MNGVIYFTEIKKEYEQKKLEHMIGEKLLAAGLKKEYGLDLKYEPKAVGEHGKPFLTLQPKIHYNITHSGDYVACILASKEVGIDIQVHREVDYKCILARMVPADLMGEILSGDDVEKAFYTQWALREAYIKWTGEGLSKDLRTIAMDNASFTLLDLKSGYSGAVCAAEPVELRWEYVDVSLD